ncbi:hypothetical protein ACIQPR_44115 [Streptomyces sp. NPDC091280]|uniref:hypothetical protein n=1 Tax=Streptomyces sp. NPDC091280 TaxID=3365984 RepID=UPI00381327B2
MRASTAGLDERIGYFAWAFENLPALADISDAVTRRSAAPSSGFADRVRVAAKNAFHLETTSDQDFGDAQTYWSLGGSADYPFGFRTPLRYADVIGSPSRYLSDPQRYFGADAALLDARGDAAAYRLMLNCFLMPFLSNTTSLPWLGVLILRGPLDRQFTIARFLKIMTEANVGGSDDSPPSRALVLDWVRAIQEGDVSVRRDTDLQETVDTYLVARRGRRRWRRGGRGE